MAHFLVNVLLHSLPKFVWTNGFENEQLHEGAPVAADVLLVGRVEIISQDLAFVEAAPALLIFLEVFDERAEELVSVCIDTQLVPHCIRQPVLAHVGEAKWVVQPSHRLDQHLVLHAV